MASGESISEHPTVSKSKQRPWSVFAQQHLGLLVTAATFSGAVMTLLGTADYDLTTAKAILQVGGTAQIALGASLSLVPFLAGLALGTATGFTCSAIADGAFRLPWIAGITAVVLPVLLVFSATFAGAAVALMLLTAASSRRRRRSDAKSVKSATAEGQLITGAPIIALFIVLLFLAVTRQPWFPSEEIDPKSGKPFTGYVVGERDESLLILGGRSARIEVVDPSSITRRFCTIHQAWWSKSLIDFVNGQRYPDCPDISADPFNLPD